MKIGVAAFLLSLLGFGTEHQIR